MHIKSDVCLFSVYFKKQVADGVLNEMKSNLLKVHLYIYLIKNHGLKF